MLKEAEIKNVLATAKDTEAMYNLVIDTVRVHAEQDWDADTLVRAAMYKGVVIGLQIALGETGLKFEKPTPRPRRRFFGRC